MSSVAEAIDRISPSFTGQLVQPTDASYDRWRRVHNGLIDKLRELKTKWDPDKFFKQNVNILPRSAGRA